MSDEQVHDEQVQPGDTEDAAGVPVDSEDDGDKHAAAQEAGKWRLKLREAEAERDALAQKVEALQRQQVDAVIEAHGVKPKAVWASGADLADLLNGDGVPDLEKVKAAVTAAKDALGIHAKPAPTGLRGLHSGTMPRPDPVSQWVRAFAPKR